MTFLLCATMTMAQQLAFPGAEDFAAFLTDMPISVRPYYAKTDNDKLAFFIDANATSNKCLNLGTASADGKGGSLEFFNGHTDRTRRHDHLPQAFPQIKQQEQLLHTNSFPRKEVTVIRLE